MSKVASLLFAIVAYAVFFATFLYLIVFVGNLGFGELSLKTVDNPARTWRSARRWSSTSR